MVSRKLLVSERYHWNMVSCITCRIEFFFFYYCFSCMSIVANVSNSYLKGVNIWLCVTLSLQTMRNSRVLLPFYVSSVYVFEQSRAGFPWQNRNWKIRRVAHLWPYPFHENTSLYRFIPGDTEFADQENLKKLVWAL